MSGTIINCCCHTKNNS